MASAKNESTVEVSSRGSGLPAHVSPSQVGTFTTCPLKYYFGSVLRWREPASQATTTGVIVHEALERLFELPPVERTPKRGAELLQAAAQKIFGESEYSEFRTDEGVAAAAKAAMDNAFVVENPMSVDVDAAGIEAKVEAVLGGVSFSGRLDRRTEGPVPRITDYKTGKRPDPRFLEDKFRQLYLYAAAEEASGRPVREIELLFLGRDAARVRRPVGPAVIAEATRALVQMRAESEAALEGMAFAARTSPLCGYCAFASACPAKSETAPVPGSIASDALLDASGLARRPARVDVPPEAMPDGSGEVV